MERKLKIVLSSMLAVGAISLSASPAHAGFTLFDNFDSYTQGALGTQGGWTSQSNSQVVANGSGSAIIPGATGSAAQNYKTIPVAQQIANSSTAATVFWQFSTPQNGTSSVSTQNVDLNNWNFIVTDAAAPADTAGSSEVQFNWDSSAGAGPRIRSGTSFLTASLDGSTVFTPKTNTFYNVWFVINNSADSYQVYVQSDGDPLVSTQTLLKSTTNVSTFTFRNAPNANALVTVNLGSGNNLATLSPTFDNIYIDNGGQDLINPTPEPTAIGLLGMGALSLLARRRRA